MGLSILVARIAATIYLAVGIGGLFDKNYYKNVMKDVFSNRGVSLLIGFMTIVLCLPLTVYHNLWVQDWRVLITLIGWIGLIKGILYLAFPKSLENFAKNLVGNNSVLFSWIVLILGVIFAYFGFVA